MPLPTELDDDLANIGFFVARTNEAVRKIFEKHGEKIEGTGRVSIADGTSAPQFELIIAAHRRVLK